MSATEANKTIARILYDARIREDRPTFFAHVAEDATLLLQGPDLFPYCGTFIGKAAMTEAMKMIQDQFDTLTYTPEVMVAEGDWVVAWIDTELKDRATQQIIKVDLADFIRFKDGKVVEFREVFDTATTIERSLGKTMRELLGA
ncbi:ketosteroid isomerase-like protein [Rhodoligotrophos appendicifer]|uniref:nuclear transport factor 2 family protein n=1 Tax=Rhodoligotrophos appendicifer TaxID=987056 RepID=UPI0011865E48|nr:nuclear transport factor 2 family protein [Rhodoligotrophos appendicifer]